MKMKRYLYRRLHEEERSVDNTSADATIPSNSELGDMQFADDALYAHKTLSIYYTTYDSRRALDKIHVERSSDIMVLSDDENHRYRYGRVIGIYDTKLYLSGALTHFSVGCKKHMQFLHVRWYTPVTTLNGGWAKKRLIPLKLDDSELSYGFVDPALVVRAVHLIPGFHHQTRPIPTPRSVAYRESDGDEEYNIFYVN